LSGIEGELRGLVRISLVLLALPVLALGIMLLLLGLNAATAPSGEMLAAGRDLTYYVNVSQVIAGSATILVGSAMVGGAGRFWAHAHRKPRRRRAQS
jgi:hypothetical protein